MSEIIHEAITFHLILRTIMVSNDTCVLIMGTSLLIYSCGLAVNTIVQTCVLVLSS